MRLNEMTTKVTREKGACFYRGVRHEGNRSVMPLTVENQNHQLLYPPCQSMWKKHRPPSQYVCVHACESMCVCMYFRCFSNNTKSFLFRPHEKRWQKSLSPVIAVEEQLTVVCKFLSKRH